MLRTLVPLMIGCLLALPALAQDAACDSKCNQQSSECLKTCVGDPKDVNKPGAAQKMMECLKKCEKETQPCRDGCKKPAAAPTPPPKA